MSDDVVDFQKRFKDMMEESKAEDEYMNYCIEHRLCPWCRGTGKIFQEEETKNEDA